MSVVSGSHSIATGDGGFLGGGAVTSFFTQGAIASAGLTRGSGGGGGGRAWASTL